MGDPNDDAQAPTLASAPTLTERAPHPTLGALVPGMRIGRYELVSRLGAGAMGVVWSAHDPQLDRRVAIKLVHPALARSPEASSRLLREARAMAKLSHRAVITVHDAGEVDGQLFLAMEQVEGTHLGAMLRTRSDAERADWRRWLRMLIEAGRGLSAAHTGGVLHRDFKPDNVLVDRAGRVCVGDFGVAALGEPPTRDAVAVASARALSLTEPQAADLTTTGSLLGTPAYMSPQQLRGEPIDARADQFAFCVATWEAVFCVRPFALPSYGDDALTALAALAATIAAGRITPPPGDSGVRIEVERVLRRGLAADPDARWPDMDALLAALERAAGLGRARTAFGAVARPRGLRVGLASAGLIAIVIGGLAVVRRAGDDGRPVSSAAPPAPPAVTAVTRLFGVSLRTTFAVSSDGTRLALGGERLEVRELGGSRIWTTMLDASAEVVNMEVDRDSVRFGLYRDAGVRRWNYAGDGKIVVETGSQGGRWHGRSALGDVFYDYDDRRYRIVGADDREVTRWTTDTPIDVFAISPGRRQLAYVEHDKFTGRLVVRDLATGRAVHSETVSSPTAVGWIDDATLLYAVGTGEEPRVLRARVGADGIERGTEAYRAPTGWFGPLRVVDDQLYMIDINPSSRARVIERTGELTAAHDFNRASVGVALGWTADGAILTWSRSTRQIERRSATGLSLTGIMLAGEPANTTLAGDVLIASLRRPGGRETVAYSLADGRALWRHDDLRTIAVRCAGDLHPPCFAVRAVPGEEAQVVTIDQATGRLGDRPIARGDLEDVAVRADGARLVLAGRGGRLREVTPGSELVAEHELDLAYVRSVAFDPLGGLLVAGTKVRNNYQVRQLRDGAQTILAQADDDILQLVRPSPEGKQVLVLARAYAPDVLRLTLPR